MLTKLSLSVSIFFLIFRMHLANQELGKKLERAEGFVHTGYSAEGGGGHVTQFGFHVPTCCGIIPQENTWCDDWVVSTHVLHLHTRRYV